jgi:hypothetical protein
VDVCKIPVHWQAGTSSPQEGYIDLHSGSLTDVPESHLQPLGSNLAASGGSPALKGWSVGRSYHDDQQHRWVPALPQWVSPDGAQYLYLDYDGSALHLVDVPSGADRIVVSGRRLYPLAWTAEGVYVMDYSTGNPASTYTLSVTDGRLTQLGAHLTGVVPVSRGGAWVASVANDVAAISGMNGPITNQVSRIDLGTGQAVRWYAQANATVMMLGIATDGMPLLLVSSGGTAQLAHLSGPGAVSDTQPLPNGADLFSVTDAYGSWFADHRGNVMLYQVGSGLKVVATAPSSTVYAMFGVAGGCARN